MAEHLVTQGIEAAHAAKEGPPETAEIREARQRRALAGKELAAAIDANNAAALAAWRARGGRSSAGLGVLRGSNTTASRTQP
jgi:hypothetical protein